MINTNILTKKYKKNVLKENHILNLHQIRVVMEHGNAFKKRNK